MQLWDGKSLAGITDLASVDVAVEVFAGPGGANQAFGCTGWVSNWCLVFARGGYIGRWIGY